MFSEDQKHLETPQIYPEILILRINFPNADISKNFIKCIINWFLS